MTLMLDLHPTRYGDIRAYQWSVEPEGEVHHFRDVFGNVASRLVAPAGLVRFWADGIVQDSGELDRRNPDAVQHPVSELPDEVLPFLLNSRYCEVDKLVPVAWDLFGTVDPGWHRVEAICDWVNSHVSFGYSYARPTKSAYDVYVERLGVCRDFNHLALTFCRCMNIPARYATGYLGDIGVPVSTAPMDFSGWFEAYLGGEWYTFDARHNAPRIGRVVMAYGRDATDVALTTSYGNAPLAGFTVWTEEVGQETLGELAPKGIQAVEPPPFPAPPFSLK